jgi:hypothetical protein
MPTAGLKARQLLLQQCILTPQLRFALPAVRKLLCQPNVLVASR